jgi:membrane-bound metal-dependent hydrolase YbcI (DUF457 family)
MNYAAHIPGGIALAAGMAWLTGSPLSIVYLAGGALGGILPDIDTGGKVVKKRNRGGEVIGSGAWEHVDTRKQPVVDEDEDLSYVPASMKLWTGTKTVGKFGSHTIGQLKKLPAPAGPLFELLGHAVDIFFIALFCGLWTPISNLLDRSYMKLYRSTLSKAPTDERGRSRFKDGCNVHRGMTHSLFGLIPLTLLVLPLSIAIGFIPYSGGVMSFLNGVLVGCIAHLLADGVCKSGVNLFWPLAKPFYFAPKNLRMSTAAIKPENQGHFLLKAYEYLNKFLAVASLVLCLAAIPPSSGLVQIPFVGDVRLASARAAQEQPTSEQINNQLVGMNLISPDENIDTGNITLNEEKEDDRSSLVADGAETGDASDGSSGNGGDDGDGGDSAGNRADGNTEGKDSQGDGNTEGKDRQGDGNTDTPAAIEVGAPDSEPEEGSSPIPADFDGSGVSDVPENIGPMALKLVDLSYKDIPKGVIKLPDGSLYIAGIGPVDSDTVNDPSIALTDAEKNKLLAAMMSENVPDLPDYTDSVGKALENAQQQGQGILGSISQLFGGSGGSWSLNPGQNGNIGLITGDGNQGVLGGFLGITPYTKTQEGSSGTEGIGGHGLKIGDVTLK